MLLRGGRASSGRVGSGELRTGESPCRLPRQLPRRFPAARRHCTPIDMPSLARCVSPTYPGMLAAQTAPGCRPPAAAARSPPPAPKTAATAHASLAGARAGTAAACPHPITSTSRLLQPVRGCASCCVCELPPPPNRRLYRSAGFPAHLDRAIDGGRARGQQRHVAVVARVPRNLSRVVPRLLLA